MAEVSEFFFVNAVEGQRQNAAFEVL